MSESTVDIAVIGAGAAGLMAGIAAARAQRAAGQTPSVVCLDGARTIGAKILVAGGGRCNVTHHAVDESAYAGSSRPAIRSVLRRFDVPQTVEFFRELGVHLKREDTGKLFPTTDRARTVVDALLAALNASGAELWHPWRVDRVERAETSGFGAAASPDPADTADTADTADPADRTDGTFVIHGHRPAGRGGESGPPLTLRTRRVIMATGGRSLPKSGSDGHGYEIVRGLGHRLTPRVFPSLVPLRLAEGDVLRELSGLAVPAGVEVRSASGKRVARFENDLLCTHFGLSGPAALDASRWWIDAFMDDRAAEVVIDWIPSLPADELDRALQRTERRGVVNYLKEHLPERLARALCGRANVDPGAPMGSLRKTARRDLVVALKEGPVPVTGNRGYLFAEVTAGGVPLKELTLRSMESKVTAGLHLCGEICDVDGRIGGFNFQWAWASGHVAGEAAAASLAASSDVGGG
ncbi:MAG: NAD(P)/FAD-dependent oxidoreductase [Phycisphaerales bacterium]